MTMEINSGDKVFVLRYNENYIKNAMELHKDLCEKEETCWYGKAGKKPNMNKLSDFIKECDAKILFYNRNSSYVGRLLEVSSEKPESGYPDYYKESMWKPNTWFKVSELEKVTDNYLNHLLVISTQKSMAETINSSMTSFYFTQAI